MRIAAIFGLVLAMVIGLLAVAEVSGLQDQGETLSGTLGAFFDRLTLMFLLVVLGAVFIGSLAAVTTWAVRGGRL